MFLCDMHHWWLIRIYVYRVK